MVDNKMRSSHFFVIPPIKETICSFLDFEEAVNFRNSLGLESLKCSFPFTDPQNNRTIILPIVDRITELLVELFRKNSFRAALIFLVGKYWDNYPSKDAEKALKLLLSLVDFTLREKEQAIFVAADYDRSFLFPLFFQRGVSIDSQNGRDYSLLMIMVQKNNLDAIQFLIQNGANVNLVNNHGRTALTLAVCTGRKKIVKELLKAGADVYHRDDQGDSILKFAAYCDQPETIDLLLESFEFPIEDLNSAFLKIVGGGKFEIIKKFIEKGVDVNFQDQYRTTALMIAVNSLEPELVQSLLEAGANPLLENYIDQTAEQQFRDAYSTEIELEQNSDYYPKYLKILQLLEDYSK